MNGVKSRASARLLDVDQVLELQDVGVAHLRLSSLLDLASRRMPQTFEIRVYPNSWSGCLVWPYLARRLMQDLVHVVGLTRDLKTVAGF